MADIDNPGLQKYRANRKNIEDRKAAAHRPKQQVQEQVPPVTVSVIGYQREVLDSIRQRNLDAAAKSIYTVETGDSMKSHLSGIESLAIAQASSAEALGRHVLEGTELKFDGKRRSIATQQRTEVEVLDQTYSGRINDAKAEVKFLDGALSELTSIKTLKPTPVNEIPRLTAYIEGKRAGDSVVTVVLGALHFPFIGFQQRTDVYADASLKPRVEKDLSEARRKLREVEEEKEKLRRQIAKKYDALGAELKRQYEVERDRIRQNAVALIDFLRGRRPDVDQANVPAPLKGYTESILYLRKKRSVRQQASQRQLIEQRTDIEMAYRESIWQLTMESSNGGSQVLDREAAVNKVRQVFNKWLKYYRDQRAGIFNLRNGNGGGT